MNIQIKHRNIGNVIYECDGVGIKAALEKAARTGAHLDGAHLDGANLEGANLEGANLYGANLKGANLDGAHLDGANLDGAHLDGANLDGAHLDGASFYKNSHVVFLELARREKIETFTDGEWAIIGIISLHRPCWSAIKARWGKSAMRIFEVLAERGFNEFQLRFLEELEK